MKYNKLEWLLGWDPQGLTRLGCAGLRPAGPRSAQLSLAGHESLLLWARIGWERIGVAAFGWVGLGLIKLELA